jgi:uncharacterized protein (UPF0332 family)
MTLSEEDRKNIIVYRIRQAEDTILDVQLLIENERLQASINRIYYGIFYALLALGLKYKFESSKHIQLIGWFNKNFIHENIFPVKYGQIINKAFNRRTKGDYDTFVEFDKKIVEEMFVEMKDFISVIKTHLINE